MGVRAHLLVEGCLLVDAAQSGVHTINDHCPSHLLEAHGDVVLAQAHLERRRLLQTQLIQDRHSQRRRAVLVNLTVHPTLIRRSDVDWCTEGPRELAAQVGGWGVVGRELVDARHCHLLLALQNVQPALLLGRRRRRRRRRRRWRGERSRQAKVTLVGLGHLAEVALGILAPALIVLLLLLLRVRNVRAARHAAADGHLDNDAWTAASLHDLLQHGLRHLDLLHRGLGRGGLRRVRR